MPKAAPKATTIMLKRMDRRLMKISLIGDSRLVCHKFEEKSKQQMRDKHMKVAAKGRPVRDPNQEYLDSMYVHPDGGWGFPSIAFKAAAVDACSHVAGVTKVEARGSFHVLGDLVQIQGDPIMREDVVRVGMGAADLRYRGSFETWSAELTITYNADMLSPEQIVSLFDIAGFSIGVGEGRPQKDRDWGMFHVAGEGE